HIRPLARRAFGALVATLALAGTAAAQDTASLPPVGGYVYTADELGNSISMIDLATGAVATVPVAIAPHNVQVTADGATLLAVGTPPTATHGHNDSGHSDSGHAESGGGQADHGSAGAGALLVFAADALAAGPRATIVVGEHPAHVV